MQVGAGVKDCVYRKHYKGEKKEYTGAPRSIALSRMVGTIGANLSRSFRNRTFRMCCRILGALCIVLRSHYR